jgi:hypothetical protein
MATILELARKMQRRSAPAPDWPGAGVRPEGHRAMLDRKLEALVAAAME